VGAERSTAADEGARGRGCAGQDDRVGVRGPHVAVDEAQGTPQLGERQIGQKNTAPYPANPTGAGAVTQLYDIPNQKVTAAYVPWPQDDPTPLRTNPLRSPGEPAGWFASETMVDEVAAAYGID